MKTVLVCNTPIPYNVIGSWNVMITNFIKNNKNSFDYIVSPKSSYFLPDVKSFIVPPLSLFNKLRTKILKDNYRKYGYWSQIKKILENEERVSLHIIDDISLTNTIFKFAEKEGLSSRIHITFYFHGYLLDTKIFKNKNLFSINKLVLLTESAYKNMIRISKEIPFEVTILKNGVDPEIFYKLSKQKKEVLRENLNLKKNKIYFLWLSQDRPKKGLFIILKAWKELIKEFNNIELLIVGNKEEVKGKQINWVGRVENINVYKYYQVSDYYLFSTLWHEGHPLSLTEALKTGLKCISSNIDPVSEVLYSGDLGYLVDSPNMVKSWVESIKYILTNNYSFNKNNLDLKQLYNYKTWEKGLNEIILDSKKN